MIVEWKRARMAPELLERFLARDAEIWTPALAARPGFAGKQVWTRPEAPGEAVLVIRWESRAAWQAVPDELLAELEERFRRAVGGEYETGPAVVFEVVAESSPSG